MKCLYQSIYVTSYLLTSSIYINLSISISLYLSIYFTLFISINPTHFISIYLSSYLSINLIFGKFLCFFLYYHFSHEFLSTFNILPLNQQYYFLTMALFSFFFSFFFYCHPTWPYISWASRSCFLKNRATAKLLYFFLFWFWENSLVY